MAGRDRVNISNGEEVMIDYQIDVRGRADINRPVEMTIAVTMVKIIIAAVQMVIVEVEVIRCNVGKGNNHQVQSRPQADVVIDYVVAVHVDG